MPNTCIHLERVKTLLDKWWIELRIHNYNDGVNGDSFVLISELGGISQGDLSYVVSNHYTSAKDANECSMKYLKKRVLAGYSVIEEREFEELNKHLKAVKNELLSIINECNCENKNNQQLVLARNNNETNLAIVRKERDRLQGERWELESKSRDLQRDLQEAKDNYKTLMSSGERAMNKKDEQIAEKDRQIERRDEQIREKEGQLTLSGTEVVRITNLFNNLQIESSNKDNKIRQKVDELRQKEREIIDLKAQLGTLSPEEVLNRRISLKRRELDGFINSLSLNYETVMNLCDAHERLDLARRNYNQNDITNARNDIRRLEGELYTFATQSNITVDDLHNKIYQNCEELAKLRAELEKLHEQQYQARQEIPPYNCNQQ